MQTEWWGMSKQYVGWAEGEDRGTEMAAIDQQEKNNNDIGLQPEI